MQVGCVWQGSFHVRDITHSMLPLPAVQPRTQVENLSDLFLKLPYTHRAQGCELHCPEDAQETDWAAVTLHIKYPSPSSHCIASFPLPAFFISILW